HDELIRATGRINVDIAVADYLLAVLKLKPRPAGNAPPHHGPNLRSLITEREINVARMGPRHFGNLAADPQRLKHRFQRALDKLRELRNGQNLGLAARMLVEQGISRGHEGREGGRERGSIG